MQKQETVANKGPNNQSRDEESYSNHRESKKNNDFKRGNQKRGGERNQQENFNKKNRHQKNNRKQQKNAEQKPAVPARKFHELPDVLVYTDGMTVAELAKKIKREPAEIIKKLFLLGVMATFKPRIIERCDWNY